MQARAAGNRGCTTDCSAPTPGVSGSPLLSSEGESTFSVLLAWGAAGAAPPEALSIALCSAERGGAGGASSLVRRTGGGGATNLGFAPTRSRSLVEIEPLLVSERSALSETGVEAGGQRAPSSVAELPAADSLAALLLVAPSSGEQMMCLAEATESLARS